MARVRYRRPGRLSGRGGVSAMADEQIARFEMSPSGREFSQRLAEEARKRRAEGNEQETGDTARD